MRLCVGVGVWEGNAFSRVVMCTVSSIHQLPGSGVAVGW